MNALFFIMIESKKKLIRMITKFCSFEYIFHLNNSTISKVPSPFSDEKPRVSRVLFRGVLKMELVRKF